MGIAADIAEDWHAALAALAWEVEAGADETMLDAPVNRYDLRAEAPKPLATSAAPDPGRTDPVATARAMAEQAQTLDALREAITGFDLCDLKKGARNTVFADGNPKARVLILGEAPGAEEDREGRPFVERHIALVDPQVIVVVGNTSLFALTGAKGILRARGNWSQAFGKPLLPMTHPAYLLRAPAAKREAWADLLSLQARLR